MATLYAGAAALRGKRRIAVIGAGGAGKTVFSSSLADATGLPLIHLDRLYWRPGWQPTPAAEWEARMIETVAADAWIIDGNYSGTLPLRLQRAEVIVLFDFPRVVCMAGVLRRILAWHGRSRPDMADGCAERFDLEFLAWVWRYPFASRPRILHKLAAAPAGVTVLTVRRRAEVQALLDGVAMPHNRSTALT